MVYRALSYRTSASSTDGSFTALSECWGTNLPTNEAWKGSNHYKTTVDIRWSQPPPVWRPGETVSLDLAVKTTHAVVNTGDPKARNLTGDVTVRVEWGSDTDSHTPSADPSVYRATSGWPFRFGSADDLDLVARVSYNESARASFTLPDAKAFKGAKAPVRAGTFYGCPITVKVYARAGNDGTWGWARRDYIYVFEAGSGQTSPAPTPTPGPVTSELRTELPPEPKDDPRTDNVPPKNGEVNPASVGEGGARPATKPATGTGRRLAWYTHPEGYYRFLLPPGWRVLDQSPIDGHDCVGQAPDRIFYLLPKRTHLSPQFPVTLIHGLATDWAAEKKSRRIDFTVGGQPASRVGFHSIQKGKSTVFWHIVVAHPKHMFYLAAFVTAEGYDPSVLPGPIQEMLGTLEFLK
jgi:hypothetical protein